MLEFGSPFTGLAYKRKLTKSEVVRANPFAVTSEHEATQVYMQLAKFINNKLVEKVFKSIADEESIYMEESLRLLQENTPGEKKFLSEGAKEMEDVIEELKERKYGNNALQTLSMEGVGSCARFHIVDYKLLRFATQN